MKINHNPQTTSKQALFLNELWLVDNIHQWPNPSVLSYSYKKCGSERILQNVHFNILPENCIGQCWVIGALWQQYRHQVQMRMDHNNLQRPSKRALFLTCWQHSPVTKLFVVIIFNWNHGLEWSWLNIYFIIFGKMLFWGWALFVARSHVSITDTFKQIRGEFQQSRSLHVFIIINVERCSFPTKLVCPFEYAIYRGEKLNSSIRKSRKSTISIS